MKRIKCLVALRGDPVVRNALALARRGDMTGVAVLADYLDEQAYPGSRTVRKLVATWQRNSTGWLTNQQWNPRGFPRWELSARCTRRLWRNVRDVFGCQWKTYPTLHEFAFGEKQRRPKRPDYRRRRQREAELEAASRG